MSIESIQVQVQNDFLNKVSQATPISALAELIWNALDADATIVNINTKQNELDAISEITVSDNGHGIPHAHSPKLFGSLGGSWKSNSTTTGQGRFLHGQEGKGRFKAFALGNLVEWDINFHNGSGNEHYKVTSEFTQLNTFNISSPENSDLASGVNVKISNIHKPVMFVDEDLICKKLKVIFAFYMMAYKNVAINVNGIAINAESMIKNQQSHSLGTISDNGIEYPYELEIVEWNEKTERNCYLCNQHSFPLEKSDRSLALFGDLYFTAYLKSEHITLLNNSGLLVLSEMDYNLSLMMDKAWTKLKEYSNELTKKTNKENLKALHQEDVYPFEAPKTDKDRALIKNFDSVAVKIQEKIPEYQKMSLKGKSIHYKLLKLAMENDSNAVSEILKADLK